MRKWPLALAAVAGLLIAGLLGYSALALARFERSEARRATFVYAAGQPLIRGLHVRLVDLAGTLVRLKYTETKGPPAAPGQFRRSAAAWDIVLRGGDGGGPREPQRVRLEIRDERIGRVLRDGQDIGAATLEPEVLTSAGDRPGEEYRPVRLADTPLVLVDAVLAAEDHRFFEHRGLDLRGVMRAAWVNMRAGKVTQGGSTITQQLVKNRLLTPKRTFVRKLSEAWLATLIEWRFSKERILEAYLNEIYLGQRGTLAIRGVGAAARAYFRKEVHQLTLGEAALLAGMARAPNIYSPTLHPDRARERRDVVLRRMRDLGKLSASDFAAARRQPLSVRPGVSAGQAAPYFTDYAREELEARYGDWLPGGGGGARVFTSLDLVLQRFAEAAVSRGLDRLETRIPRLRRAQPAERLQAVLIALDPLTGEIRALVGGRDYGASQFNRATLARRQPGSAFKPFVYLAALAPRDSGAATYTAASLVDDAPISVDVAGEPWSPGNYEDRYEGRVSVRRALEHSLNTATVRIALGVGLPAVVEAARAMGLSSPLTPVPAMTLGAFEVVPMELARAYLPLANGGIRPGGPAAIRLVYAADGEPVPVDGWESMRVISEAEAYLMTSLLEGVVNNGTGARARGNGLTGAIAGKTGTTNDARDAWFVGYSSRLLTLVWVGFDATDTHGLSAAEAALPIWTDFMRQAGEVYPVEQAFVPPPGITFTDVDPTTGRLATVFCPIRAPEAFLTGTEPQACDEHGGPVEQMTEWWRRFRDWLRR
ncbi:MAG: PBP1A family penicillin-binding protein [Candidatus Rokuibacteriota bacterium]